MKSLYLDIETYSSVDLAKCGAFKYADGSDTQILMVAYCIDDGPMQIIEYPTREDMLWVEDPTYLKIAHNAQFEMVLLAGVLGLHIDPERWLDTMQEAAVAGLPKSLESLGKILKITEKMDVGKSLIRKFSIPQRGVQKTAADFPGDWDLFKEYCMQDVEVTRAAHLKMETRFGTVLGTQEKEIWNLDWEINSRGIKIDSTLVDQAISTSTRSIEKTAAELAELTGVENPNSGKQMIEYLQSVGVYTSSLAKDSIESLLAGDLPDDARTALELKQQIAGTAVKKFDAIRRRLQDDSMIRGCLQYYGSHTGRWAGRGVQPQNMPNLGISRDEEAFYIDMVKADIAVDLGIMKALIRPTFCDGYFVADFSAIEARVLAWLAGEQWVLDAFAAGRDIYIETASQMYGVPYEEASSLRKKGKVAVLALGYASGLGGLRAMGAQGTDSELYEIRNLYREANPNIRDLWYDMEQCFRKGGTISTGLVTVEVHGSSRRVILPSGRSLWYHSVAERPMRSYDGLGVEQALTCADMRSMAHKKIYGGLLVENVTQAVARDLLAEALLRLDRADYDVVCHVHDEVLVADSSGSLDDVIDIMTQAPAWADGLPLAAEGYQCDRYRKE